MLTLVFILYLQVPLLEGVNENLHNSSHHDKEDEDVVVLDDLQNIKEEKEEGGTKGEDWDEVRF